MEKKHNITFNNLFRPAPAVVRKNKALALKKLISLGHFILLAVS
jgi:hypothetical protein